MSAAPWWASENAWKKIAIWVTGLSLVVLIFLRDWRATLISAIAIPLSAIPAFLTVAMIPLTFSIANGLAFGITAHAIL